jgi:type II secretory pathway component PulF
VKIGLDALSRFAFCMATCLRTALPPQRALELSATTVQSRALGHAVRAAIRAVERGERIADALQTHARCFPGFVLPVIRAGELSGRQVEAFQLIYEHSERLKLPMTVVRNTWLYPLVCVVVGWIIRLGLFLGFGMYGMAWQFALDTFGSLALLTVMTYLLLQIPVVKQGVDRLLLQLPLVRETLIRHSVVLFFATFKLAYEAGGSAVTTLFDIALATVGNSAVRRDLHRARDVLEANGGFEDAFQEPALLEDSIKSSIAAGALSGHLVSTLAQIVKTESMELEISLDKFNRIFQRLVAFGVAMSIVGTFLMCFFYSRRL